MALLKLRRNGECFVDIPETVFDMDYPGHYFRRIKAVGLSIPCTVGPYTTVACTLTLVSNHLRKDSTLLAGKYERDTTIDDPRFRDEVGAIQSIATSGAQNDDGLFELSFRDERYLPFEGAGAISSWHIKLNKDLPQFDYETISDVIAPRELHGSGGRRSCCASKAVDEFNKRLNDLALAESRRGLLRLFDLKREFPDKWYRFLHPANPADDQEIVLTDLVDRLPFFAHGFATKKVRQIELVAEIKDGATYKALVSPLGTAPTDLLSLSPDPTYSGLHRGLKDLTGSEVDFGSWTIKLRDDAAGGLQVPGRRCSRRAAADRELHGGVMLSNAEIDRLIQRVVESARPEKVIIFGSYAKGTATAASDLDILVVVDSELPMSLRAAHLMPPPSPSWISVDVHVYTPEEVEEYGNEPFSFVHSVLATGRTVYDGSATQCAGLGERLAVTEVRPSD